MTDFHALDLSQDRAALHRWDGRAWRPVGAASCAGDGAARALADLLEPVAGMPVAVALPPARIATDDIDDPDGTVSPADSRIDWVARPSGGWRRLTLPHTAMGEIEDFLRALGVRPGGCMAAAGDGLPAAWFGTLDCATTDGRATDRPACLGPAAPAPQTRAAAARRRARDAARQDPAYLAPLPDVPQQDGATARVSGAGWRLHGLALLRPRASGWRGLAALVLVAMLIAGGVFALRSGPDPAPVALTPDVAALAPGPAPAEAPTSVPAPARTATPHRAARPVLDTASGSSLPAAPRPARQASLSAMDTPPGMEPAATFYTPPFRLADHALDTAATLTIPGLDPVFRTDALALATTRTPESEPAARRALSPPGPPDQVYVVDERGLIRPSPDGRLSPDGFTVMAGPPPVATRPRPAPADPAEIVRVARRADLAADDPLRRLLPRARPDGLAERRERDLLGGRTATELAGFAPAPRPPSAQERADPAGAPPSALALATGPRPAPRDTAVIARARAAAAQPGGPAIAAADVARVAAPTAAATSERATRRVGIDLSQINLLGTFGSANDRRALVRLPTGRVVNIAVGDRMDGGRVQSIGDGRLGYTKSGRTVTLEMPRG